MPRSLCRTKVWIGMKVLQANSIILGTRKLWRIFPITTVWPKWEMEKTIYPNMYITYNLWIYMDNLQFTVRHLIAELPHYYTVVSELLRPKMDLVWGSPQLNSYHYITCSDWHLRIQYFKTLWDACHLLCDVETHTVDTSLIFTKKSNVAKCFFDICTAEMAQSLSSLQKSEY